MNKTNVPEKYYDIAFKKTDKHIKRVSELMNFCSNTLHERGIKHDASKYQDIEMNAMAEMERILEKEGEVTFNSPEYHSRMAILKPMLDHHYKNNSHHPEHYPDGIQDMNLFDIVEMAMDWIAASERHGSQYVNITSQQERFGMSEDLTKIMKNTIEKMGAKTK